MNLKWCDYCQEYHQLSEEKMQEDEHGNTYCSKWNYHGKDEEE